MVSFLKATLCVPVLIWCSSAHAQTCHYVLTGKVVDAQKQTVPGVVVHIADDTTGTVTDSVGRFSLGSICPGKHTIIFEALAYKKRAVDIVTDKDVTINITLTADDTLGTVVVTGEKVPVKDLHTVAATELKGLALLQARGQSLGEALKEIAGVDAVQTGPSLWKPVIHGLHSNRVLIINNGVRQEGQQWGSEHAPEIDPFVANTITVIKGAASVRYGSDAIGGVVLLAPEEIPDKKGVSGDVYAVGATNGQMGAVSAALQGALGKKLSGLSWRVQGTLRDAGNFHTPRYYLINTGLREGDFSGSLCYKYKGWDFDLYYSQYNTRVGIFVGAESGNAAELVQKFSQPTPGLPSYFTYNIGRPYQVVNHELARGVATYKWNNGGKLELTLGRQNDRRREYDELSISPTADPNLPQLSFQLITHSAELVYTQASKNGFSGSAGITGNTSGNIFEGIRYLIPNFRDYNGGAFAIERYTAGKFLFEAGVRYDYRWLRVYQRNQSTLALYNTTYTYSNATGTAGVTYHYNDHLWASLNAGTAWRAPSINEMYIYGEHFSDASFEVGDSSLKSERSLNSGLSLNYSGHNLRLVADAYLNHISNYIYDKPALKVRQLPSGTFPEFDYTQADATIHGIDASLQYDFLHHFTFGSKVTIVRGYNNTIHDWLISMPCDRWQNSISWQLPHIARLSSSYISVEDVAVSRQTRVPPNSDFVSPPAGYNLLNAHIGTTIPFRHQSLSVDLSASNITNVSYRDYLDHFRYYADELGVNYTLRLKFSF